MDNSPANNLDNLQDNAPSSSDAHINNNSGITDDKATDEKISANNANINKKRSPQFILLENLIVGIFPVLVYIGISVVVSKAVKAGEAGGWLVFLYMAVAPVCATCIAALAYQFTKYKTKLSIFFIVIDAILAVLCGLIFSGHPEIALFWMK